jgi:hypothetical protein
MDMNSDFDKSLDPIEEEFEKVVSMGSFKSDDSMIESEESFK